MVIQSTVFLNFRAIETISLTWVLSFFLRALNFYLQGKKKVKKEKKNKTNKQNPRIIPWAFFSFITTCGVSQFQAGLHLEGTVIPRGLACLRTKQEVEAVVPATASCSSPFEEWVRIFNLNRILGRQVQGSGGDLYFTSSYLLSLYTLLCKFIFLRFSPSYATFRSRVTSLGKYCYSLEYGLFFPPIMVLKVLFSRRKSQTRSFKIEKDKKKQKFNAPPLRASLTMTTW